jgi:hypothetical protein
MTDAVRFATVSRLGGRFAPVGVAALLSASCGDAMLQSRAPVLIVIDALQASSGARPGLSGTLESDVLTFVESNVDGQQKRVPTVFQDTGEVTARLILKDPGTPGFPASASDLQSVTIDRYRVEYIRADGRNTPGIDVPYRFDGAVTFTLGAQGGTFGSTTASFTLVRIQAKVEAPLKALVGGGGAKVISTIAVVTFYGRDMAGNTISAEGRISINFSDWGDPD